MQCADKTGLGRFSFVAAALAAILAFGAYPQEGVRAEDWPMWAYDVARSAQTPAQLAAELHLQWTRELAPPRRAWPAQPEDHDKLEFDLSYAPVVMGDKMFVPSMVSDRLTAYRIADGAEVWRHYADGPMRVAPAAWNGKVYAVSDDGRLYCFDADTGAVLWTYNAAPDDQRVLGNTRVISMWPARGGPVVKDGAVYFAAGVWPLMGTFVFALDAETGEELWANTADGDTWQRQPHWAAYAFAGLAPQGYLAISGDRLVVSGGRGVPGVFDRHTGRLLHMDMWDSKPRGGYQVMVDDEHYYFFGRRYSLSDGRYRGRGPSPSVNEALLERAEGLADWDGDPIYTVLAAQGRLFVVTEGGRIHCFGPQETAPAVHEHAPALPEARDDEAGRRAAEIFFQSGAHSGYALFLGVGDGDVMEQLALRSNLHIVGVDSDAGKIAALRRRFDEASLYGTRIALMSDAPATVNYPPFISALIVVPDPAAAGLGDGAGMERVFGLLRPYGGKAFFGFGPGGAAVARRAELPEGGRADAAGDCVVLTREGPLPNTGQWTHEYADSANTNISYDELVRLPLGVLWFGGPTHHNIVPRHASGVRPQVAGGRVVLLGPETISARDVYTGRELWVREFPGIGHPFTILEMEARWAEGRGTRLSGRPGAAYIGSPYVSLPDSVYLRYQGAVHRMDPDTGATLGEFRLPVELGDADVDWGHISVHGDLLITTVRTHIFEEGRLGGDDRWDGTSSEELVVLDRFSGEVLWTREADIGYRHNAIVAANGTVFTIDGLSEEAMGFLARRGVVSDRPARLMALDGRTGAVKWETNEDVFGTFLHYSPEHGLLLEGGARGFKGGQPSDEPHSLLAARRADSGERLWRRGAGVGPRILRGDHLLSGGGTGASYTLPDGGAWAAPHPLTGEDHEWRFWKTYGCGPANASQNFALFRSGAAGYTDLENLGGTGSLGGFKAGCSASLVPADGVLNAPDYTRTCTCSYQNQTSLGLIHMPQVDVWTGTRVGRGNGPILRAGVNLGAPGNRRADDGTLWMPYPRTGVPTPELQVALETGDVGDSPVRVVGVSARSWVTDVEGALTLDGDPVSGTTFRSGRDGVWNQWIQYDLSRPAEVDGLSVLWETPDGTRFEVQASMDGRDWATVYEGEHSGKSDEPVTFAFDAVEVQHVRLHFDRHPGGRSFAYVHNVRFGGLPDPAAYAAFVRPEGLFRVHTRLVDGTNGLNWVAASGVRDVRKLTLDDIGGEGQPYTVRLHFSEPDAVGAGERVFDVRIQGQLLAEGVDIAALSGGRRRAVVKTFRNVAVGDSLTVEFEPSAQASLAPVFSGMEISMEEAE